MDYLNETAREIPPGDQGSYLGDIAKRKNKGPTAGTFKPSDIPGFVNPIVEGKVDKTAYIPAGATQGDEPPPIYSREEALQQQKKRKPTEEVLYKDPEL